MADIGDTVRLSRIDAKTYQVDTAGDVTGTVVATARAGFVVVRIPDERGSAMVVHESTIENHGGGGATGESADHGG